MSNIDPDLAGLFAQFLQANRNTTPPIGPIPRLSPVSIAQPIAPVVPAWNPAAQAAQPPQRPRAIAPAAAAQADDPLQWPDIPAALFIAPALSPTKPARLPRTYKATSRDNVKFSVLDVEVWLMTNLVLECRSVMICRILLGPWAN